MFTLLIFLIKCIINIRKHNIFGKYVSYLPLVVLIRVVILLYMTWVDVAKVYILKSIYFGCSHAAAGCNRLHHESQPCGSPPKKIRHATSRIFMALTVPQIFLKFRALLLITILY